MPSLGREGNSGLPRFFSAAFETSSWCSYPFALTMDVYVLFELSVVSEVSSSFSTSLFVVSSVVFKLVIARIEFRSPLYSIEGQRTGS